MRLKSLILWDVKFQVKNGFYLLYGILTVLYLIVLLALPVTWRGRTAAILIFSDPAAMGLFFMGAVVLLEKSQRVPCALAVSPVKAMEYIIAKVVSLSSIALIVAAILASAADVPHMFRLLLGTALSGVVFTLLGIIIATKISSLNQFILCTVPIEMLGFIPPLLHLFGISSGRMQYYPANVCIDLIAGNKITAIGLTVVILLIAVLLSIAHTCTLTMWKTAGGIKI